MCWALHHFLDLPRMFMTIYLQQSNMYKTLRELIIKHRYINMRFLYQTQDSGNAREQSQH